MSTIQIPLKVDNTQQQTQGTQPLDKNVPVPSAPVLSNEDLNAQNLAEQLSADNLEGHIDGTATSQEPTKLFFYNVVELFYHNSNHSMARTVLTAFAGIFLVIPTFIYDLGRRIAFEAGFGDGKTISLIDKTSDACQAIADKISGILGLKEPTLEEKNARSEAKIKALAGELVDNYEKLNGGHFHSNDSFSTPYAINAQKQIIKIQNALVVEAKEYAINNCDNNADDFRKEASNCAGIIQDAIKETAADKIIITNKTVRQGPQSLISEIAVNEFINAINSSEILGTAWIDVVKQGPNPIQDIKNAVDQNFIKKQKAQEIVKTHAPTVYTENLETGIDAAEKETKTLLESAEKAGLIDQKMAKEINDNIKPPVEQLAEAAAKDIVRNKTPEADIKKALISIFNGLKAKFRLNESNTDSQFLSPAEASIEQAKQKLIAEEQKAKEAAIKKAEEEKIAAEKKAAEEVKQAAQKTLEGNFRGMLEIIDRKQNSLSRKHDQLKTLDGQFQLAVQELKTNSGEKIVINGKEILVTDAATTILHQLVEAAEKDSTPERRSAKLEKMQGNVSLVDETIKQINKTHPIPQKILGIVTNQAKLAKDLKREHHDLAGLVETYTTYNNNNSKTLENKEKSGIFGLEEQMFNKQKDLQKLYGGLVTTSVIKAFFAKPAVKTTEIKDTNEKLVTNLVKSLNSHKQRKLDAEKKKVEEETAKKLKEEEAQKAAAAKMLGKAEKAIEAPKSFFETHFPNAAQHLSRLPNPMNWFRV